MGESVIGELSDKSAVRSLKVVRELVEGQDDGRGGKSSSRGGCGSRGCFVEQAGRLCRRRQRSDTAMKLYHLKNAVRA